MQEIIHTKLFIPPPRPDRVFLQHLIDRLNTGLHHELTLISAPVDVGKMILVSEWVEIL